jgi:hypothetical protein
MFRRVYIPLFLLVAALALIFPLLSRAQEQPKINTMEVGLWPEFDQPEMLVIYHIQLPADLSFPVDMTLRIPAVADEPNAVAVREADGGLYTIPYDRQISGEWALISFTATLPDVQIEYYDPSLKKEGAKRQFTYRWPGDYAVDSFTIQVQQPKGASDLSISSGSYTPTTGNMGMVYYSKQIGSLGVGEEFSVSLSYTKEGNALSVESLPVEPSVPVTNPSTSSLRSQVLTVLPWGLGVLGIVLIVGGGWWYWQSGRRKTSASPPRRRRAASASQDVPAGEGYIYCHQCGKRAAPGDRFCRACGTRLRTE